MYYVRDIGNAIFDVVRNAPFTIRRSESANAIVPNLNWQQDSLSSAFLHSFWQPNSRRRPPMSLSGRLECSGN